MSTGNLGEAARPLAPAMATAGRRAADRIAASQLLDRIGRAVQTPLKKLFAQRLGRPAKDLLNGTWLGHPLHAAVTDVPLGAWSVAAVLDIVTMTGGPELGRAARAAQNIGIAGAAVAVLTGLADWVDTSREQRRVGVAHAGLNSLALVAQIASVTSRVERPRLARTLSLAAFGTAAAAGYLGGDLVFRYGTQVDRNAHVRPLRRFTAAMASDDLPADVPTRAVVAGQAVVLVRRDAEIFALDDTCSHQGCALSTGRLEADAIVCPCHGSTFRLRDGAVLHGPSPYPQQSFEVRTAEGRIELRSRAPHSAAPRKQ